MSEQNSNSDTETVTDSSYIITLVQRLVSERLLVDVTFAESASSLHTSTLLKVLPREGAFLLDDIFPQSGAAMLDVDAQVQIRAYNKGGAITFKSRVAELTEDSGLRLWRMDLPESIRYQQARSQHRVKLASLRIPVRIYLGEGQVLTGLLVDMSAEGLAIRLPKSDGLKRGKAYRCTIHHSETESVEVEVEVTRAVKLSGRLPVQIGTRLHKMSPHDSLQWQRYLAEIERRLLRTPAQG